jgi:Tfp pilus assembly protein PilO
VSRKVVLIGVAAALVVTLIWYLALWGPRKRSFDDARDRADRAERERTELAARIERLKAAQADEPRLRAAVESLRTAIPDEPNLAQFILDTNQAAVRSGIDFISITPSPPAAATPTTTPAAPPAPGVPSAPAAAPAAAEPAPLPAEVALNLQIGGGYFQVLDFLNRLDALPRLVVTDGLSITSDDKARLTVGLTARMFVRTVPPGYAPAGTAGAPAGTAVSPPTTASPAGGRS